MALRKHVTLDETGIAQTRNLIATRTDDERIRDGGTPGSKHVFLHNRHLPFFSVSELTNRKEGIPQNPFDYGTARRKLQESLTIAFALCYYVPI
jgi:hypothetical protein